MNEFAKLTKRECEVAELSAWGATKKDIARRLFISLRTVENHYRNIYGKTGCSKVNELSAWWFCTRFNISFKLSPMDRAGAACVMLLLSMYQVFHNEDMVRSFRSKTPDARVCRTTRRKGEQDFVYDFMA